MKDLEQRYEELRQYLLAWGAFHPSEKANCLKILEAMSPDLRKNFPTASQTMVMLIEDQKLYIERQDAENQSLKEEVENLKDELEERKAYIVANPCAQCGGKINAEKCGAWTRRSNEFERRLEIAIKALKVHSRTPSIAEALRQIEESNDR